MAEDKERKDSMAPQAGTDTGELQSPSGAGIRENHGGFPSPDTNGAGMFKSGDGEEDDLPVVTNSHADECAPNGTGRNMPAGGDDLPVVTNSHADETSGPADTGIQPHKKKPKKALVILGALLGGLLAVALVVGSVYLAGVSRLKKELLRDWSRVDSNDGTYYNLVLDFNDDTIDYKFESGFVWLNTTLTNFDYKVVAPDRIKVTMPGGKTKYIKIRFNDDRDMITMTPAMTSSEDSEYWFNDD